MVIIERIEGAIKSGLLVPQTVSKNKPVVFIGDLMKPWEEFFTGKPTYEDNWGQGKDVSIGHVDFKSRPRRSAMPLPLPKVVTAPVKDLSPGIFRSVQGVWEWYQQIGKADESLLKLRLTMNNFDTFIGTLFTEAEKWYPLVTGLEELDEVFEMDGLYLRMPYLHGDEEGAGMFQACLEGPTEVAGMLTHYYRENDLSLAKKDRKLIRKNSLVDMTIFYAQSKGEKLWDFKKLEDWFVSFFTDVDERYPDKHIDQYPIVSWDHSEEVCIRSAEDINFAIAFSEAFYDMQCAAPAYWNMEMNEEGETERVLTDICRTWRREYRK